MTEKLNIVTTNIEVGASEPFSLLHITDSHISLADERDTDEIKQHADARRTEFEGAYGKGSSDAFFKAQIQYAAENDLTVACTGDLIDFLSHANLDYLGHAFDGVKDHIYAAGNHDFCHFVGRAKEDAQYKRDNMKKVAPFVKSNMLFDSKVINGVNLVTLDNSYYLISDGQTGMLRAEAAKGFPIILFVHNPFYVEELAEHQMKKTPCAYVVGAPERYIEKYTPDRQLQQRPDAATLRAIDYIMEEKLIKAVFAGHLHYNFECKLENGVMQYCTEAGYRGGARRINIR